MEFSIFYEGKKATLTVNSVEKDNIICNANITLKVGGRRIYENVNVNTGMDFEGHLMLVTYDFEKIDITKNKDLIDYLYTEQGQGRMSNIHPYVSFVY